MAMNTVHCSLYHLCCGLLMTLREANRTEVNLLEDPEFAEFRNLLDGQIKKQNNWRIDILASLYPFPG